MTAIALKNLTKSFGKVSVIPDLDLDIEAGEFVVFVGPSGCGKSTLLRMIAGLEDATSGEIWIRGREVSDLPPVERGISMVFQSYALYPHMTVFNNIAFGLEIAGLAKDMIRTKVEAAAEILNLTNYLDRKPAQLSGGQRQRVAIGRAIVREPEVFLFDEPLSNLDAALRIQMRLEIIRLHQSLDTTMIYVTHDQVEAMTMADRIAVFDAGRIQQFGTPSELYNRPSNLFVAGFIGSPKMNFLTGAAAAQYDAATIGVRPEHLDISVDKGDFEGVVQVAENLGSDTFTYLETDHGELTVRTEGEKSFDVGQPVYLTPRAGRVHKFDANGNAV